MVDAASPANFTIAFAAGIVSFASPCMLPLVPGYLAFLVGPEMASSDDAGVQRRQIRQAIVFVASFATLFTALGLGAALLGGSVVHARRGIEIGAGILIALMGLTMVCEPFLPIGARRRIGSRLPGSSKGRVIDAIILGVAFAAAWSPCLGPALAAILALASSQQHATTGALLLLTYSFGLGLPFIAIAAASRRLTPVIRRMGRHLRLVQLGSGILLLVFGIAVAAGLLGALSARLSSVGSFGI